MRTSSRGFSLLELLVSIAIVGILLSLLIPAVQASREATRRIQCANNLRQLALAAHGFHGTQGTFPPGLDQFLASSSPQYRGTGLFAYLLPHLERGNILADWDYESPLNNAYGGPAARAATVMSDLVCPSDAIDENPTVRGGRYFGMTSYGGNGGRQSFDPALATCDGIFHTTGTASEPNTDQSPVSLRMVTDGASHTILFGERYHEDPDYESFAARNWGDTLGHLGRWAAIGGRKSIADVTMSALVAINYRMPVDFEHGQDAEPPVSSPTEFYDYQQRRMCAFGSGHRRGANFAMADGSVQFLDESLALSTLQALSTRNGQELIRRK